MSNSFPQYPLTDFPDSGTPDSFTRLRDPNSSEMVLIKQYKEFLDTGNYTSAQAIITSNPSLLECQINATAINKLYDAVMCLQAYYLDRIDPDLQAMLTQAETDLQEQLTEFQTSFNTWFAALEASLEGNVATNLQNQINTVNANISSLQQLAVPTGFIGMWSGLVTAIPNGWHVCDGTSGTPDLRDRFIVGSGGTYAIGDTGGSDTVSLTETNLPQHKHEVSILSTSNGAVTPTATVSTTGSHSHTKGTLTIGGGSHTHTASSDNTTFVHSYNFSGGFGPTTITEAATGNDITNVVTNLNMYYESINHNHTITVNSATHTHTLTGSTSDTGDHSHTVTISAIPNHTHNVVGDTDYTGGDIAHENRPPFYSLAFIMKL